MEMNTVYFENRGKENTEKALALAKKVTLSTTDRVLGRLAETLIEACREKMLGS